MFKNIFLLSLLFSFCVVIKSADQERPMSTGLEDSVMIDGDDQSTESDNTQVMQAEKTFADAQTQTSEVEPSELKIDGLKIEEARTYEQGVADGISQATQELLSYCDEIDAARAAQRAERAQYEQLPE